MSDASWESPMARHKAQYAPVPAAWPERSLGFWGGLLVALVLLPVLITRGGEGRWLWDTFELAQGNALVVALMVLPHATGLFAWWGRRRVSRGCMGGVLVAVGAVYLLVVLLGAGILSEVRGSDRATLYTLASLLGVVFAPILVAAGNHVQRREGGARGPAILVSVGGILAVAWLVVPVRGTLPVMWIFAPGALLALWPIALFGVLWVATFLRAAFLVRRPPEERVAAGARLSRRLRVCAWLAPGFLLLQTSRLVLPGFESVVPTYGSLRTYLVVLATMILVAIGAVLLLRRRTTDGRSASQEHVAEVF